MAGTRSAGRGWATGVSVISREFRRIDSPDEVAIIFALATNEPGRDRKIINAPAVGQEERAMASQNRFPVQLDIESLSRLLDTAWAEIHNRQTIIDPVATKQRLARCIIEMSLRGDDDLLDSVENVLFVFLLSEVNRPIGMSETSDSTAASAAEVRASAGRWH